MGLDMYLTRKTFIPNTNYKIIAMQNNKPAPIKTNKIIYIEEDLHTWRKANQIHNWFVKHCQNNDDDCKPYSIDHEQLQELLDTINKVLNDHTLAEQLLPTTEGFFFGSTDYDKNYYSDLQETKEKLEEILKEPNITAAEIYYQSSW